MEVLTKTMENNVYLSELMEIELALKISVYRNSHAC